MIFRSVDTVRRETIRLKKMWIKNEISTDERTISHISLVNSVIIPLKQIAFYNY